MYFKKNGCKVVKETSYSDRKEEMGREGNNILVTILF